MGKRSGIQLCYPFEERRLLEPKFGWKFPVIVQPKLDGERCRAVMTPEGIKLLSSECNEIISVPHINSQIESLAKSTSYTELDGELYIHGWDFNEIHSVISRKSDETRHEKSELMEFHVFDTVSDLPQLRRTFQLYKDYEELFDISIKTVPLIFANNMADIMKIYDFYIDQGYEGIIIRNLHTPYVRKRSRFMMKFKPKKDDYYKIIKVIEAISKHGEPLKMIGAFQCAGSDGTLFNVGAGKLSHQERKDLWKDRESLIGKYCHVQYQNITSGGVPRFALCIEIVNNNPEEASGEGIL